MSAPNNPDPFPIAEKQLMRQLGLADRDDMRSMRDELLIEEVDWSKVGLRIMLSEAAARKIASHLKALPIHLASISSAQKNARSFVPTDGETTRLPHSPESLATVKAVRLLVLSTRVLNPRILVCCFPDDRTRRVYVRVKSNKNFRPLPAKTGEILALHIEGTLYEFAGNPQSQSNDVPRCPRWPGRW